MSKNTAQTFVMLHIYFVQNFVIFPKFFGFPLLTDTHFSAKIKARTSVTDGMWSTTGEQKLIFADRLGCSEDFSVRTALIFIIL